MEPPPPPDDETPFGNRDVGSTIATASQGGNDSDSEPNSNSFLLTPLVAAWCTGEHVPHYPVTFAPPCPINLILTNLILTHGSIAWDHAGRMHAFSHEVGRDPTRAEADGLAEHYSKMNRNKSWANELGFDAGLVHAWRTRKAPSYLFNHVRWDELPPGRFRDVLSALARHWVARAGHQVWRAAKCSIGGLAIGYVLSGLYNHRIVYGRMLSDERLREYCSINFRQEGSEVDEMV